jgi:hypothetical protein
MVNPYSIAGTLVVLVALAGAWRAWVKQAAESGFMDRALRKAGHVPPETDTERTVMIPTVRMSNPDDDTLSYGKHSVGWMAIKSRSYRGEHRTRWLSLRSVSVSSLLDREGSPA